MDRQREYKGCRIHLSSLMGGQYVGMIVNIGGRKRVTRNSLTNTVIRVPGEYRSEDEALHSAEQYIDAEEYQESNQS